MTVGMASLAKTGERPAAASLTDLIRSPGATPVAGVFDGDVGPAVPKGSGDSRVSTSRVRGLSASRALRISAS